MVARQQTACGFDKDNMDFFTRHKRETGESMSEFLNKRTREWRIANPEQDNQPVVAGQAPQTAVAASAAHEAVVEKIKKFLLSRDHILYSAKTQRKPNKNDLGRIKDELFFSEFKVDTTAEIIRPILRDMIEQFDPKDYEKRKGIKKDVKR